MPDEDVAGPIQAAPAAGAVEALRQMDAAGDHGSVAQHVRGGDALEFGVRVCERRPGRVARSALVARCTVIIISSPLLMSEQPLAGYRSSSNRIR